jgi:hypothetical protein
MHNPFPCGKDSFEKTHRFSFSFSFILVPGCTIVQSMHTIYVIGFEYIPLWAVVGVGRVEMSSHDASHDTAFVHIAVLS